MSSFVDGPSAVVSDNQQYWLELHRPQQQQQQPADAIDDSLHLPARIINRNQLQLLGVIGEGAFGRVLKGVLSLSSFQSRGVLASCIIIHARALLEL